MFGAESAIVRTSLVWLDAKDFGQFRRRRELQAIVVLHVTTDEVLALAVRRTSLAKVDSPIADNDLRRCEREAFRTQALRRAEKGVVAKFHALTRVVSAKQMVRNHAFESTTMQITQNVKNAMIEARAIKAMIPSTLKTSATTLPCLTVAAVAGLA